MPAILDQDLEDVERGALWLRSLTGLILGELYFRRGRTGNKKFNRKLSWFRRIVTASTMTIAGTALKTKYRKWWVEKEIRWAIVNDDVRRYNVAVRLGEALGMQIDPD